MSLRSALVDTGHIVATESTGRKIAGQTEMATVRKPPFKCRVSAPTRNEIEGDRIRFTQYVRDLTLLCGTKDIDGDTLSIGADDIIKVESGPYEGTYEVYGQPVPIRKKSKMIGWEVSLREHRGKVA